MKKIPKYLFVIRPHDTHIKFYVLKQELNNNKVLYQDGENGFLECFFLDEITKGE